jgi:pyruvate dehydrogenase E2 component (dihydrolipoamide acetyltransferase)
MAAPIYPITMPKWGIEMTEGTITGWHAQAGSNVAKGEPLLDVETEKIVNAVESPVAGTLRRILADTGEVRPVGSLIAVFADASVPESDIDAFVASFKGAVVNFEPDAGATSTPAASAPAEVAAPTEGADGESRVSPIARRLAERLGIDISRVKGTGRNGRISKEDVEAFAAAQGATGSTASTASSNAPTRIAMSSMRATIARRLLESSQGIPAFRTAIDVDMGALLALKARLTDAGTKVTITDLLVRALGLALVEHPMVNAQLEGNDILQFPQADIAVAVATDGGLVTPIVRGANRKSLGEIAAATRDLAARAKSGGLQRDEISGGTFTLSNLGMFGISAFDAIINPPQVAILAVAATETRAVVRNGQVAVASLCTMTLTSDHRVVDGAVAAAFLTTLRRRIEDAAGL